MKSKISRILGVVLTLSMLVSLALTATPVSAGTQAWSAQSIPSATGLVLDSGNTWTGPFAINKDKTAIFAGSDVGGLAPAVGKTLVKSTTGGRTWTALSGVPALSSGLGVVTDIVCSSLDANIVYITDGNDIYKSSDGGTTWAPLSNLFGSLGLTYGLGNDGIIVSIDVGYLGTAPYIFAATSTFGAGLGGAFVCEEAIFGMPWTNMMIDQDRVTPWGLGVTDVLSIQVDPTTFATTQAVMAVATHYYVNSVITCKYGGAKWDATVNDITLGPGGTLYSASLWLPSDFSATLASGKMQCLAGKAVIGAGGDVFLAVFAAPAVLDTASFDLNIGGPASATEVFGLSGIGAMATAAVMASGYNNATSTLPVVYASKNGGLTWTPNIKGPVGGASPWTGTALSSLLVLDATTAIVGTHGASDNGVSITKDFGATWNGISLLNSAINTVNDLAVGSLYMATNQTAGNIDSIWRYDGTNWERVFTSAQFGAADMISLSATGGALFAMDAGGTAIWRSLDNGQIWMAIVSPVPTAIRSFLAVDATSLVVGSDANVVYTSPNGGVIWFTRTCSVGTVQTLVRASNGHLLAGGTSAGAAKVARSTDVGVTWTAITASVPLGLDALDTGDVVTNVVVAFSSNYAVDSTIFATGTSTADATGGDDSGIFSYNYAWTTPAWAKIDTAFPALGAADVTNGVGLVSAPGGPSGSVMVYAADAGAAGEGASRIRYSTFASATANLNKAEQLPDAGVTITKGLWQDPTSKALYTLAGNVIRTYTDTLNVAGAGVAASAITTTTATVTATKLTNATGYLVVVNATAQTDYYNAVNSAGVAVVVTVPATGTTFSAAVTGLIPNTAYNVSVWASAPVSSFQFNAVAFTTLPLAPEAPPVNLIPANGAINQPISQLAFAWSAPSGGATSYRWQLTTDPTFATFTEGNLSTALTYLVHTGTLKYSTSYYWRVQSVTASGVSGWVTSVFTTVAAPAPVVTVPPAPTPTIIVTQPQPTVIVTVVPPVVTTQPQQTVIVTVVPPVVTQTTITQTIQLPVQKAPVYIWAIVAIGAVLTLAVIVLIVRTRRVV